MAAIITNMKSNALIGLKYAKNKGKKLISLNNKFQRKKKKKSIYLTHTGRFSALNYIIVKCCKMLKVIFKIYVNI